MDSVLEMGNIVTEYANYVPPEISAADFEEYTDDNELVLSIRKLLDGSYSSFSSALCIYRAPKSVRKFNEAAYHTYLIAIGPHHLRNETSWEKELKRAYCKKLIERSNKSLNVIIKHLEESKVRVYDCYEGYKMHDWEYLNVILFHSCFIIKHLIRSHYTDLREPSDNIPSMQRLRTRIKRDLLILDNQIPYFLLESLFNLVDPFSLSPRKEGSPNFNDLVMSFFKEYNIHDALPDFRSVKHFTDLIRTLHEPKRQSWDPRYPDFELIASATQLHNAGVEFKMVSGKCLLDINFENRCLELPCFEINDDQESLFRNLIAFELCHYPNDTFIIDYFVFMDTLINTSDDVSLLVKAGVLVNRIGDYSDAANTFNKFCAGITRYRASSSYLVPVYGKLNAYYKKPKHTWMTSFKRDYFGSPLRTASTATAVSLVVLTFISTVCSIISVT